jgi:hypothetical protein
MGRKKLSIENLGEGRINSPRTLEALKRLGLDAYDLQGKS